MTQYAGVPRKRGHLDRDSHAGRSRVKTEAEIGSYVCKPKDTRLCPRTTKSRGRGMGPDLARDLRRSQLWRPHALDVWPPDWGRVSPVVGSPQSVVLCHGSPRAQTHWDLITKARLTAHEARLSPVPLGVTPSPRG